MLTREQIKQQLRIRRTELSTTRKYLFGVNAAASLVPERKIRYVVGIWLIGDGTSRTVNIERIKEDPSAVDPPADADCTMLFPAVPVPPADQVPVPEGWEFDIENPFMLCEGGTNLTGKASAGAPNAVVIWFDDIER